MFWFKAMVWSWPSTLSQTDVHLSLHMPCYTRHSFKLPLILCESLLNFLKRSPFLTFLPCMRSIYASIISMQQCPFFHGPVWSFFYGTNHFSLHHQICTLLTEIIFLGCGSLSLSFFEFLTKYLTLKVQSCPLLSSLCNLCLLVWLLLAYLLHTFILKSENLQFSSMSKYKNSFFFMDKNNAEITQANVLGKKWTIRNAEHNLKIVNLFNRLLGL